MIGMKVLVARGMTSFNPHDVQYAYVVGYDKNYDQLWVRNCDKPDESAIIEWASIIGIAVSETTTVMIKYEGLRSP